MSEEVPDTSGFPEIILPPGSGVGTDSPQVESLRTRARSALLSRRKADARDILGKLVPLSGDPGDRKNLDELIKGVDEELRNFTASRGSIEKRLLDRTPLETIQEELTQRIPHWRAFANDLPGLNRARAGLPAHADPTLKDRLKDLEARLGAGEVLAVLEDWDNMGTPAGAANPGFVQLADILGKLSEQIEARDWKASQTAHYETVNLLKEDECAAFRQGVETHVRHTGEIIRWETLLTECKGYLPAPDRKNKQRLAEALYAAADGIARRVGSDSSLKDLQTRLLNMREKIESAEAKPERKGSGMIWAILIMLAIVAALIAAWFRLGFSSPQARSGTWPSPGRSQTAIRPSFASEQLSIQT